MDDIEVMDVDNLYADLVDCRKQEYLLSRRIAEQELKNVQKILSEAQSKATDAEKRMKLLAQHNLHCAGAMGLDKPLFLLTEASGRLYRCYASIVNCLNDINRTKAKEA